LVGGVEFEFGEPDGGDGGGGGVEFDLGFVGALGVGGLAYDDGFGGQVGVVFDVPGVVRGEGGLLCRLFLGVLGSLGVVGVGLGGVVVGGGYVGGRCGVSVGGDGGVGLDSGVLRGVVPLPADEDEHAEGRDGHYFSHFWVHTKSVS